MTEEKINQEFRSIVNEIKNEIKTTQIKVAVEANKNSINLYFKLGKILNDNYKYGNKFIDDISRELKLEFPNIEGFSVRNLKYMKKFYIEYKEEQKKINKSNTNNFFISLGSCIILFVALHLLNKKI
jgi:predicted nuclease of restriction endonuclease-like (RecB) superfamily